ncbi:hypothetical protein DFP72DRAFT_46912 [Ephemerocybe angulata]|uniref:Nephrocystin 3-like N-terminal domain-containing protein n=1 Tax=Ephemerocybe angulata TaxID=980116 RepID=A0A8H6LYD4_9AGAR|nr:hypothetical protein DFP72DRAFT_46912 [Tulosesus angulatus]
MESMKEQRSRPSPMNEGPHFFQGAREFNVNNQYNIGEQRNIINSGTLLDILHPIPNASYARNRKTSPPDSSCLPGTRKDVLRKVVDWVDSSLLLNDSHVMWLYGYVGCGKSAIAQAVAERYAGKKRLAASFFFFRGSGDRSRVARFAATVASQVAASIPSTASTIEAAAKAHAGLLDPSMSLGAQFKHLVYDPIDAIKWAKMGLNMLKGPYLIVIDGLDECDDREEIASFIDHMLEFFRKNPRVPLRFLITSRVEEHLRTRLNSSSQVHLVSLVDHTSLDDIAAAMRASFDLAAKHDRIIASYGNQWPIPSDFDQLVQHTGCSFIFMATIIKFILEPAGDGLSPLDRLPLVLNIDPGLDGLYSQTLARSRHLHHFSDIIATIALVREPLSVIGLAELLNIETFKVVEVLVNLHAILQVPGDDHTPVTLCHTSLRDFLLEECRSGSLCASVSYHEQLTYQCFRVIGNFAKKDDDKTPESSNYAAENWRYHLEQLSLVPGSTKPAEYRKHLAMRIISRLRNSYLGDFDQVVACYILMDFDLPFSTAMTTAKPTFPPVVCDIEGHIEFLEPYVPASTSRIILEVLKLLVDGPNMRRFLKDVWNEFTPPLTDLRSFHCTIVTLGRHHLLCSLASPSPSGLRMRFAESGRSKYSRYIFLWLFFNWMNYLALALNDDRAFDWRRLSEETPITVYSENPSTDERMLQELTQTLYMKNSREDKEHFLGGVQSALRAVHRRALWEQSPEPRMPTEEWRWETTPGIVVFFGSTNFKPSCWNVLAAFIKLAESMEWGRVPMSVTYKPVNSGQMRHLQNTWVRCAHRETGLLQPYRFATFFGHLNGIFEVKIYPAEYNIHKVLS